MGIRLYRRWLAVISLSVVTGFQALSVDTLLNLYLGTQEFFINYMMLLIFIGLLFAAGYFLFMIPENHFRIMGRYRGETAKSERRGYWVLGLYLLLTLSLMLWAGEATVDR